MKDRKLQELFDCEKTKWVKLSYGEWLERDATPANPIIYEANIDDQVCVVEVGCLEITEEYVHPDIEARLTGESWIKWLGSFFKGNPHYDWIVYADGSMDL